jgi:hypothetical protein
MAKSKSHPLDSLTFTAPKLDEAPPVVSAPPTAPAAPKEEVDAEETRSSNVTLPVRIWEWIDAKHAEARSKGGKPLRKAAIIRAVFEVAMSSDVNLSGAQSEDDIATRISRAIKQQHNRTIN